MASATPLVQASWSPLTPASASAPRDGVQAGRVSSSQDASKGFRTGVTCVNITPSTSGSSLQLKESQGRKHFLGTALRTKRGGDFSAETSPRVVKTQAAVREAAIESPPTTNSVAAALEVAYREPSFGLDDVLALSDELEVVGPPPDWSLSPEKAAQSPVILPRVQGDVAIDSVRRGLDDVFEMSGDLDILGPSPDDTSGFAVIAQGAGAGRGLQWPQIAETVVPVVRESVFENGLESGLESGPSVAELGSEASEASDAKLHPELTEVAEREIQISAESNTSDLSWTAGEGLREVASRGLRHLTSIPLRELVSKAAGLAPAKTPKARVKRGDKKLVRHRWGAVDSPTGAIVKTPLRTPKSTVVDVDGLVDAPVLKAIYQEGVTNIGSRAGSKLGAGRVPAGGLTFVNEWNLLTAEEEKKLALVIQRSKALVALKDELEAGAEAPASEEQWAEAAGIAVNALGRQIAAGKEARQRLVECNLRLVVFAAQAMKHYPNALPMEDLFLAGIHGLLIAVDKFDPALENRFSTFALPVIRSYLRRAIQRSGALIAAPVKRTTGLVNLDKVRKELSVQLGRLPTTEEIAKYKNVSVDLVKDVFKWYRGMDVTFNDFAEGWDKFSSATVSENPEEGLLAIDEEYLKSDLEQCISTLPAKEGEVLRRRYGLGGRPPATLREIGDELGMSYEMVRRYEARAMILMRKAQRMERLSQYRPMLGTAMGS